jgi:hypothetical protein
VADRDHFFPIPFSTSHTLRVVWLFPDPVRTAVTAITGTLLFSWVALGPITMKSGPIEATQEALCITYSWETSL